MTNQSFTSLCWDLGPFSLQDFFNSIKVDLYIYVPKNTNNCLKALYTGDSGKESSGRTSLYGVFVSICYVWFSLNMAQGIKSNIPTLILALHSTLFQMQLCKLKACCNLLFREKRPSQLLEKNSFLVNLL